MPFSKSGGVFLKTQCEDGSVKSQNFEPDAERFKAKLRGFRKENTRIFIIHYKDETNLEFMTKKNKEETMDEAAENFLLLRFFELTGIDLLTTKGGINRLSVLKYHRYLDHID